MRWYLPLHISLSAAKLCSHRLWDEMGSVSALPGKVLYINQASGLRSWESVSVWHSISVHFTELARWLRLSPRETAEQIVSPIRATKSPITAGPWKYLPRIRFTAEQTAILQTNRSAMWVFFGHFIPLSRYYFTQFSHNTTGAVPLATSNPALVATGKAECLRKTSKCAPGGSGIWEAAHGCMSI